MATRRLRAFLRAASAFVDADWSADVRGRLKVVADALGGVRDLDVLLERLRGEVDALPVQEQRDARPLLRALQRERTAARRKLLALLRSPAYFELLDLLEQGPPQHDPGKADPTLAALWYRDWRKLGRSMKPLGGESPDDELHAARLRLKRARYTAELAGPTLGKSGAAFVKQAKALQDVLGEHQDATVAELRLRELAKSAAAAPAFVAGRLVERERRRRARAREAWPTEWKRLQKAAEALPAR